MHSQMKTHAENSSMQHLAQLLVNQIVSAPKHGVLQLIPGFGVLQLIPGFVRI